MSRSKSYELYVYFVELKSPSPKLQLSTFTSLLPWSLNHARARNLEVQNIGLVVDGLCVPPAATVAKAIDDMSKARCVTLSSYPFGCIE
jgi:hypothetical protein